MPTVRIDTGQIRDWDSFHDVFADALGFPSFYGRSLDAWMDCMVDPDEDDGMKGVVGSVGDPVVLVLSDGRSFKQRCPHQWTGIVEVVASLNLGRVENGKPPLLVLAFAPGDPPYVGYGSVEPPLPEEPALEPGWKVK
jgi:RNAse (barnase) inhibitor barstar